MKKKVFFKILKWIGILLIIFLLVLFFYMKITGKNINEVGLEILTIMKKVKGENVVLSKISREEGGTITHQMWDELLEKYVSKDGKVNYRDWLKDRTKLTAYLDLLSENPPAKNWNEKEELAYWINAYNAFTVQLILDHYPVKSIKEIGGSIPMSNTAWDMKFFKIGGVDFDLNTIEHSILRIKFQESRIHFAINCASISCPILRNEAYSATLLDQQLKQQTLLFLEDATKNKISETKIKISKIFDWFKGDFTKNSTLKDFLRIQSGIAFSDKVTINFMEYDWDLNEL